MNVALWLEASGRIRLNRQQPTQRLARTEKDDAAVNLHHGPLRSPGGS